MIDDFEARWRSLIEVGEADTREVDAESTIRMVFGVDPLTNPFFSVIVDEKPGLPRLHGAVSVERRVRKDGRWTLTLVLNDHQLQDVFVALVVDLAAKCADAGSPRDAVVALLDEVGNWQRLLRGKRERLSEERLRGLVAELWFGFVSGYHGMDSDQAVTSWDGPLGGYQDFQFPQPAPTYEVKATRPTRDVVTVSSEFQLDGPAVRLAAVTLAESFEDGAFNLPDIVEQVRRSFAEPEARIEFQRRFVETRVDLDDPWYADQRFTVTDLRVYEIRQEFPALRRSNLPEALRNTEYRLDLSFVEDFQLEHLVYEPKAGARRES